MHLRELWLRGVTSLDAPSLLSLASLCELEVLALGNACRALDDAALCAFLDALARAEARVESGSVDAERERVRFPRFRAVS